jgi:hypothetical protein
MAWHSPCLVRTVDPRERTASNRVR